ncbi:MAG: hypothetical protein Q9211_002600 [Gyalolechia sp. 1 TL-2023]
MANTNFPEPMPVVWLQASDDASLNRSLAKLHSSISNLPCDTSGKLQGRDEGWIRGPDGLFRYIIQCPAESSVEDTVMQTEPTPQQTKESRDERYQRILQRRQEAEDRKIQKRRRSQSPSPEVRQTLEVPTASSGLTTPGLDNMTLDTDGYPIERGHPRNSSRVLASTDSLEQPAHKKKRIGAWLDGVKTETVENETLENLASENSNGDAVSQTPVAIRVIQPLRRSPRH